jgi:hypothetical protein
MTTDEALDLALEALKHGVTRLNYLGEAKGCIPLHDAITAIKQARALDKKAENARELGLDYQPVPENFIDALKFDVAMRDAAPVQEPVAWMRTTDITELTDSEPEEDGYTPLYTTLPAAQRQWVGLTPHERMMCRSYDIDTAIDKTEAKLKEKNT